VDTVLDDHHRQYSTTAETQLQNFSAPPLVFRERFLIAAGSNGMIVGWDLWKLEKIQHQLEAVQEEEPVTNGDGTTRYSSRRVHPKPTSIDTWETLAPDFQWSADAHPRSLQQQPHVFIVQIIPAPKSFMPFYDDDDLVGDEETFMIAITSAGTVYILTLVVEVVAEEIGTGTTPPPSSYDYEFKTVLSWNTTASWDICSVAVTTRSNCDFQNTEAATNRTCLHMGYQRGKLETWTVAATQQPLFSQDPAAVEGVTDHGISRSLHWKPQLLLQAEFMDQTPDIVGIARLGHQHSIPEERTTPSWTSNDREYLVLMLRHDRGIAAASTATCQVEVIDMTAALARNSSADPAVRLNLEEFFIFPQPGREIVGPPTTIHHGIRSFPWTYHSIPSRGTNAVLTTNEGLVAVTTSEGMVILLDGESPCLSAISKADDHPTWQRPGLLWGVSRNTDQHILTYPPVGIGSVTYEDHRFIAVCLRGTTTYLIATEPQSDFDGTVYSFRVPMDHFIGEKNHKSYAQQLYQIEHFGTGNLQTNDTTNISLLLYAWPGGTIDIYSCGLLKKVYKE
jgi:hypothetical protein